MFIDEFIILPTIDFDLKYNVRTCVYMHIFNYWF